MLASTPGAPGDDVGLGCALLARAFHAGTDFKRARKLGVGEACDELRAKR